MNLNANKNLVLISGACIFKELRGKTKWFLIKQCEENGWEIPKIIVRKGESSVRAVLRMMGEKANMATRVLEEVGRFGGITTLNGKKLPQRQIFYLMMQKFQSGEVIGFPESNWFDLNKTIKNLSSKREKDVIKSANSILKKLKKKGLKIKKLYEEDESEEEIEL